MSVFDTFYLDKIHEKYIFNVHIVCIRGCETNLKLQKMFIGNGSRHIILSLNIIRKSFKINTCTVANRLHTGMMYRFLNRLTSRRFCKYKISMDQKLRRKRHINNLVCSSWCPVKSFAVSFKRVVYGENAFWPVMDFFLNAILQVGWWGKM